VFEKEVRWSFIEKPLDRERLMVALRNALEELGYDG